MTHLCPDCGIEHGDPVVEPVIEVDPEPAADAAVDIARIEADRDVTIAKVAAGVEKGWQEQRIVELEAKLSGMADTIAAMAPPAPELEPVVIEPAPEPEPIVEPVQPPPIVEPGPAKSKHRNAFWP